MPPKRKGASSKVKLSVKTVRKTANLVEDRNGGLDNENKQKKIATNLDNSRLESDTKGKAVKRKKTETSTKPLKEDKAKQNVARAVMHEDGHEMALKVMKEQDAEFASEVDGDDQAESDASSVNENEYSDRSRAVSTDRNEEQSSDTESQGQRSGEESDIIMRDRRHLSPRDSPVEESPERNRDHRGRSRSRKKTRSKTRSVSSRKVHYEQRPTSTRKAGHKNKQRNRSREKLMKALDEIKGMVTKQDYRCESEEEYEYDSSDYEHEPPRKQKRCRPGKINSLISYKSDTTIYQSAGRLAAGSSSEGNINTSNETIELDLSASMIDPVLEQGELSRNLDIVGHREGSERRERDHYDDGLPQVDLPPPPP